jgi:hypothetical protein
MMLAKSITGLQSIDTIEMMRQQILPDKACGALNVDAPKDASGGRGLTRAVVFIKAFSKPDIPDLILAFILDSVG